MAKKILMTISIIGIMLSACNLTKKANEKTIYIGAETKPCTVGVSQKECLQVKWSKDQTEWELFDGDIEDFTYEKGNEYELLISEEKVENPTAEAVSMKYKLIKEVSKNKVEITSTITPKPFTSTHVFTAKYEGISFHKCMGLTLDCPEKCGSSGNMASFQVIDYKDFVVNGQGGTEKLTSYSVLISDYYKNDLDKPYVSVIKSLKEGDEVTIHVEYVYDTTLATVATVENIISITKK